MKVLIVGGGIAGLTLAALLQQRGLEPTVVEKASSYKDVGYMLGLYPLGSDVLHGLNLYQDYVDRSLTMNYYEVRNGHADIVHSYNLDGLTEQYGAMRGISRKDLIDVLLLKVDSSSIRMSTSVSELEQDDNEVRVTFSDGEKDSFDLVVGADGIGSQVRTLLLGDKHSGYETDWGGWLWWLEPDTVPMDTITEYWAAGRMMGIYPCKDRVGCFAGSSIKGIAEDKLHDKDRLLKKFEVFQGEIPKYLQVLQKTERPYFIHFQDVRAKDWHQGRVVLIGDAAAAFLPTAGVGASMAMNCAAALNDVLSRADAKHVPHALMLYEKRIRKRIERCQDQSRNLAKLMFVDSVPVAFGREFLMHFYTVDMLLKDIRQIMDEPL